MYRRHMRDRCDIHSPLSDPHALDASQVTRKEECVYLLQDASHNARGNGSSTLTNIEALTGFKRKWLADLTQHLDVVAWHDHLGGVFGPFRPV